MARVVVVALVERHVPLACGVVKGAVPGHAACGAAQDRAVEALLRVADSAALILCLGSWVLGLGFWVLGSELWSWARSELYFSAFILRGRYFW